MKAERTLMTKSCPTRNAVIVDFIDGKKVFSIECKDKALLDKMYEYAKRLLLANE